MLPETRHSIQSLFIIILLGIALGLAYVLISDNDLSLEVSRIREDSPDAGTKGITGSLDFKVHVMVFEQEGKIDERSRRYLHLLSRRTDLITFSVIDPDTHPGLARMYGIRKYGQAAVLGRNRQVLIEAATGPEIVKAILCLKHDRQKVVNVLSGHGEADILDTGRGGLSRLMEVMEKCGHAVRRVTFAEPGSRLPDGDVLIVPGPKIPFADREVEGLLRWTRQGGKLILTLDPSEDGGLEAFLEGFGVGFDGTCIYDPSGRVLGSDETVLSVGTFGADSRFSGLSASAVFPEAGPLIIKGGKSPRIRITWIARTSRASIARAAYGPGPGQRKGQDDARQLQGPLNVCLSITQENDDNKGAGIIVYGDTDFLTNAYLGVSGNRDLFCASLNMILGGQDPIPAGPEGPGDKPFIMTAHEAVTVFMLVVIVMPCLVILPGVILARRRARL